MARRSVRSDGSMQTERGNRRPLNPDDRTLPVEAWIKATNCRYIKEVHENSPVSKVDGWDYKLEPMEMKFEQNCNLY